MDLSEFAAPELQIKQRPKDLSKCVTCKTADRVTPIGHCAPCHEQHKRKRTLTYTNRRRGSGRVKDIPHQCSRCTTPTTAELCTDCSEMQAKVRSDPSFIHLLEVDE